MIEDVKDFLWNLAGIPVFLGLLLVPACIAGCTGGVAHLLNRDLVAAEAKCEELGGKVTTTKIGTHIGAFGYDSHTDINITYCDGGSYWMLASEEERKELPSHLDVSSQLRGPRCTKWGYTGRTSCP